MRTFPCLSLRLIGGTALAMLVACGAPSKPLRSDTSPVPAASGKSFKREGPATVPPVRMGAVEFRAVHWGFDRGLQQNGGYISAHDPASGRELWLLKVYDVTYDSKRERDVQDNFIAKMLPALSGRLLEITDEVGRRFEVDPTTRTVRAR